jgi:hypothetical protein
MKRLLLTLCLLVLPVLATAQPREALLTADGTLFAIESRVPADPDTTAADRSLVLRMQNGSDVREEIVPATLQSGAHMEPAMAYDAESHALFVFWLRHTGITASELMFACRTGEGVWSEARVFGERFDYRENLRIAVTRRVAEEDGSISGSAAISVHLVWWEYNSRTGREAAQYAMLAIENGEPVGEPEYLDLSPFAAAEATDEAAPEVDRAVLKQPLLFSARTQDSVSVVFGDFVTNRLHQVRVQPTRTPPPVAAEGRLRVPVGRSGGNLGGPALRVAGDSRVEGIFEDSGRMAIYTRGPERLDYAILRDGSWGAPQVVTLDEQITAGAALDALRQLVGEH